MAHGGRSYKQPLQISSERVCRFDLKDLVRVDFVFPYGRVAASGSDLLPEPFDRDADYATDPSQMEELKKSVKALFEGQGHDKHSK